MARVGAVEDAVCVLPGQWAQADSAPASSTPAKLAPSSAGWWRRMFAALRRRVIARWPAIRRTLPRDLALLLLVGIVTSNFFAVAWVLTDSVHASLALVIKGARPQAGELAVFAYSGQSIEGYYSEDALSRLAHRVAHTFGRETALAGPRKGDGFVKYLVGTPGDVVERVDRDFFLTTSKGRFFVGHAKTQSRRGVPLEASNGTVIPPGYVWVWSPHVDALDSRYAAVGLVPASTIVGKGVLLW